MPRPNTIAPSRQNSVWIDCILQCFVEAPQCMVVERIGLHDVVVEGRRRAVLAPSMLGSDLDQFPEYCANLLIHLDIACDRQSDDVQEGALERLIRELNRRERQPVAARKVAQDIVGGHGRFTGTWHNRREEHVADNGSALVLFQVADTEGAQGRNADIYRVRQFVDLRLWQRQRLYLELEASAR